MFRSLLFIPGNNERFLKKSTNLLPDILCFDLEDSVSSNQKEIARTMVASHLASQEGDKESSNYVRINSLDSGLVDGDLERVLIKGLDGIVIPKVSNSEEVIQIIHKIDAIVSKRDLSPRIRIVPSIETAKGVINASSIASVHENVVALVFGVFDYLYDMKLDYENEGLEYSYARAKIPVDARAAGIPALDSIWQKVDDLDGLQRDAKIAKRLGYAGKSIIHPKHIEPVHNVFVPSQNEIEWAKKVVSKLNQIQEQADKRGAFKIDGRMIDAVHFKQAKLILDYIAKHENL